jgi:hypothetical protein
MSTRVSQLLTISITLIWLVLIYQLLFKLTAATSLLILSAFSLSALSVMLVRGTSRFSAMTGKILIVMSTVMLITYVINSHQITFNIPFTIPLIALITGLYIERINPQQKLYTWMFLGISAKVQAILIYTLQATDAGIYSTFDLRWWWLILACMIAGVLMLIFHKFFWYRILVTFTTVIGLLLTISTVFYAHSSPYLLTLSILAFLWPMITMRAIGRKVISSSQNQAA